jgi:AcrR family transcriptional regulator
MDDKKDRILEYALKKFTGSGYSSTTMEEIARGCGFGKATIYKYFDSKQTLLMESIVFFSGHMKLYIDAVLADDAIPPAEKLGEFIKPLIGTLSRVSAAMLDDMRRNAPKAYSLLDTKRHELIFENISKIIKNGKKSGAFRDDVDAELVAHIVIGAVSHMADPDVMATLNYTPAQILGAIVSVIINGCRRI